MAVTATVTKLFEGAKHVHYQFTGVSSDTTDEAAVQKIDISTLTSDGRTPVRLSLIDIHGDSSGFGGVEFLWDRDTDVTIGVYSNDVEVSYDRVGGNHDTGTGGSGDILVTTHGAIADATYNFVTKWRKKYT